LVYFAKCPKREGDPHPPSLLLPPGEVNEAVVGLCALREARCSGGGLPSSLLDEPPRGRRDDISANNMNYIYWDCFTVFRKKRVGEIGGYLLVMCKNIIKKVGWGYEPPPTLP